MQGPDIWFIDCSFCQPFEIHDDAIPLRDHALPKGKSLLRDGDGALLPAHAVIARRLYGTARFNCHEKLSTLIDQHPGICPFGFDGK